MSTRDEGFIARWSRRKQAAEESGTPAERPAEQPALASEVGAPEAKPPEAKPPEAKSEEVFDLSKLPAIESLGKNSDYSMFMHKAVPDDLRLKALRRMWATDPVLAAPDLLDMHAWDYTGTDGIKPLVTPALEAIAAMAREAAERARKAALEEKPSAESPAVQTAEKEPGSEPDQQSSG